jgi:hypothetical protein
LFLSSSPTIVNTEQLRQSLKIKWLSYYRDNRSWLARLGVWVDADGQRRPSSSFILATLSVLEPQLTQLLPLVVDLSSSPDRIVRALGLNFNPDQQLDRLDRLEAKKDDAIEPTRMLPSGKTNPADLRPQVKVSHPVSITDESCRGSRSDTVSEIKSN